jgi:hypothetical protein
VFAVLLGGERGNCRDVANVDLEWLGAARPQRAVQDEQATVM